MSLLPADQVKLWNRGRISLGMAADLVLFDRLVAESRSSIRGPEEDVARPLSLQTHPTHGEGGRLRRSCWIAFTRCPRRFFLLLMNRGYSEVSHKRGCGTSHLVAVA